MNFNKFVEIANKDYDFLQKFCKRTQKIKGVFFDDLAFLPYKDLKHTIPELVNKQEFEGVIHLIIKHKKKNITFKSIKRIDNHIKFSFILWILDQYKFIAELEQYYLSTPPDAKLVNAGIRDLDILGDKVLIDNLVKEWKVYTHEQVENMPYSFIFNKQLQNTIENRISKKLSEQTK